MYCISNTALAIEYIFDFFFFEHFRESLFYIGVFYPIFSKNYSATYLHTIIFNLEYLSYKDRRKHCKYTISSIAFFNKNKYQNNSQNSSILSLMFHTCKAD